MKKLLTFIGLLIVSHTLLAASFDCAKASTKVERMICAEADLGVADQWLSNYYTRALLRLSAEQRIIVKNDQKSWLSKRDLCTDKQCIKSAIENQFSRIEVIAGPQSIWSSGQGASALADEYSVFHERVKSIQAYWEDDDVELLNIELSIWENTRRYLVFEEEIFVNLKDVMRSISGRRYLLLNKFTGKLEDRPLINDLEEFNNLNLRAIRHARVKSFAGQDCGQNEIDNLRLLYSIPSVEGIGLIRDVPNVAYGSECDVAFVLPWSVAKPYLTNFGKQLMNEFTGK